MRENIDYITNFYRKTLYDKKNEIYLVTLDDFNHVFLDKKSMKELKRGKIESQELYEKLKDAGVIIDDENINQVIENLQKRYLGLFKPAGLHIIAPTMRCNLKCKYCFADPFDIVDKNSYTDMSEETAKKVVEFIMNTANKSIVFEFTGGEPTIRFDLVKYMIEYAKQLNEKYQKELKFSIVSNLTVMNEEIANYITKNEISLCTSLDGNKEVHDANRIIYGKNHKEIGTHDNVVYWINKLNQLYKKNGSKKRVSALMTITKKSLPYYKEIIDQYVQLGLKQVDIRPVGFLGRATNKENETNLYTKKEFLDFYTKALNYINYLNLKGIDINDRMRGLYSKKIIYKIPHLHINFDSPWGAGTGSLSYHPTGDIYAIHEALGTGDFYLGNIYNHTRKDLFSSKETSFTILASLLESNNRCDRCVYKPFCATSPIHNLYSEKKINFYPTNSTIHYETKFHCEKIFNRLLKQEKKFLS